MTFPEPVVAIPSYNDPKSLRRCVRSIRKYSPCISIYVVEQVSHTKDIIDDVTFYKHHPSQLGVGMARKVVTNYVLRDHPGSVIIHMDDDTVVHGSGVMEKANQIIRQYPEFAWVGALGAFKHWYISGGMSQDDIINKIHFCTNIGAGFAAINPEFIKKHGHFDHSFITKEDVELCSRAWANGWFVGMVDIQIRSPRKKRDISHPFHPKSEQYLSANEKIASLYHGHFKLVGNRKLRKRFDFPEESFTLREDIRDLSITWIKKECKS